MNSALGGSVRIPKKIKRKKQQIILSLINEYFSKMKEISRLVDPIIVSSFDDSQGKITNTDDLRQKLYESAMKRIGKPKMRSHIAMMGYEICEGKNPNAFLPIAAAMDLLEFSYYCSDKIFDTDIYKNRVAVEDKIIVSHILTSSAYQLIADSVEFLDINTKQYSEVMRTVSRFIRDIYEGFFIENHNTEPSMELYERRTYAYNYWEHILKIAAIAAGANDEKRDALANFGRYVGMAYMMTNDAADIVKDFEDIKNQRYTLPNILFLEKANVEEKNLFASVFGNEIEDRNTLEKIGKIMINNGIINECQAYASELVEKALPYLSVFNDTQEKRMLAVSTRAVYNNQWYRKMNELYGFQRTVTPCDLELAGINLFEV
ncbi:Short chain isoprenyl diphosphate synthase [uncultured archaeon]|nr:Short chain isoprenyl diphosphate synthase [uncultured archaeon]